MTANRRARARSPITRPYVAHLLSMAGTVVTVAVPVDVSRSGFRTDATGEFRVGERLRLEPQRPHPLGGRCFTFTVVWSKPSPGAEVGGVFAEEITEAEREALATG
jgi:hypothetical protein